MHTTDRFAPIRALMLTDVYKLGHLQQYRLAGTPEVVYSNWTNRGSRIEGVDHVVHFGLQVFLAKLETWFEPFFAADEDEVCALYEERLTQILGPNSIGTDHIRALHRKGYLPLKFNAVQEGTAVPLRVPSFTFENTDPEFFWLTNYVETIVSAEVWQPSTSATIAREFRRVLEAGCERTGGDPAAIDWQGHDFSFRGMSSVETAAASGAGHLLSFSGTDSLPSLDYIEQFYGGEYVAGSVPATEHSVMCAGAAVVGEKELFSRLIDLYPAGIFSVVSDTFNLWEVLTDFLPEFKDRILARDGKMVIRPDSGDPVDILCGELGDDSHADQSPAAKGVVELLWDTFGGTINEAGYRVLDPHIGAIYGDSITRDRAHQIIDRLAAKGFASTNVVFGVGSFTYQYQTRDTFMSAVKATWALVDGVGYDLQKDPITDNGTKKSARGRLAVFRNDEGELYLVEQATPEQEAASELQPVWRDGAFLRTQTFAEVRETMKGNR
ncbi:nicotinate phosphoribosyltransferase [Leucobacter viscericola]|uniref:Nicotinamide phosphoribosyltransferase n=1 Tax=Leucobacter viscericola TaxID=2714935 RepID=A0A6G7XFK6_9MICO|nr:nicotinate phosphoribosyltransferase [Leucobacter viscericola]QIK63333.1 nicotinate phosphoribosyltransferase [Leucobacter viscericola]